MKYVYSVISAIVFYFLLFLPFSRLAAQEEIRPGQVTISDLEMKACPFDSSAEAMVLADIGTTRFIPDNKNGFMIIYERLIRIKIFTREGYSHANYEIPLYHEGSEAEIIKFIKGRTYNLENGKIIEDELEKKSIFTENSNSNISIKKPTFAHVREGSVIEIQFQIASPFLRYIKPWAFQGTIPVLWSEYKTVIPEFFNFSTKLTGYLPFAIDKHDTIFYYEKTSGNQGREYDQYTYHVALKNAPAFSDEPYTSSPENCISSIRYELISVKVPYGRVIHIAETWDDVIRTLLNHKSFGGQLSDTLKVSGIVNEIKAKAGSKQDQMIFAYNYVKNNIKWNRMGTVYPSQPISETIINKTGNSADINILLLLILRNLDFEADPVVLSTRQNGYLLESHPSVNDLNYVIVYLNFEGKEYLLDATDPSRPFNILPFDCLNGKGLIVGNSGRHWIYLLNKESNSILYVGTFKIDTTGKISGDLKVSTSGYQAIGTRDLYALFGKELCEKSVHEAFNKWDVTDVSFDTIEDINEPLVITCRLESDGMTGSNGEMLYFNALLSFSDNTNPFVKEERKYPIDFGCPSREHFIFQFEIPEGWKVVSLPNSVKINLKDKFGSFNFITSSDEKKIVIVSKYQRNMSHFDVSEYGILREFLTQVAARQSQQVVVKKTEK